MKIAFKDLKIARTLEFTGKYTTILKKSYRDEHIPWQQSSNSEPVKDDVNKLKFILRTRR